MLAGHVITGFSVSLTVTLKLQVAMLPESSVAVQVTKLVPLANVEPLAGLHAVVTPGQLSLATARPKSHCSWCTGPDQSMSEYWPDR